MPGKTSGIRAGRAFVELGVNDATQRALKSAEKRLKAFGASVAKIGAGLTALGAGLGGPLLAAAKQFSDQGDAVAKMSKRTGIAVEELQGLGHAAELSGANIESLEKGVRKMQQNLVDAGRGMGDAKDALEELGLSADALLNLSPEEQFKAIADRIAEVEDPTRKAALAMDIFGRAGSQLIPLLNEGSSGIRAMQEEARRLGIVLSAEAAAQSELLNDNITRLKKTLAGVTNQIGAALAPALNKILEYITPLVASVSKWVQENQAVVVTIAQVAVGLFAAGTVIASLGGAFVLAGIAAGGLASAFGTMASIASGVAAAVLAIINPVNLLAIACVAAVGAVIYFSDTGSQAIEYLLDRFRSLKSFIGTVIGGITDALAAGDIPLAASVLWKGLKVAWEVGTLELRKIWEGTKGFFVGIFYDMLAGALNISQTIFHGIEVAWIETTSFMASAWTKFTSFLSDTWLTVANILEKTWNRIKGLFDSSFDAARANLEADQKLADSLAANEGEKNAALGGIESRRQFQRDQAAQVDQATREEIAKAHVNSLDELGAEGSKKIQAAADELAKARAELDGAVKNAADARQEAEKETAKRPEFKAFDPDALGSQVQQKATAIGSFSASNLAQLFAPDDARRTADGMDRLVKLTEQANAVRQRGAVFV